MPQFINASGRTVAQPNGEDWPDGVTLTQWSEQQLRALLAYGHVVPVPAPRPKPKPQPAPEPGAQGQDAPPAAPAARQRRATRAKEPL